MIPVPITPRALRALYPVPEARVLLGGLSNQAFYDRVNDGTIRLTKIGRRSFVSDAEIDRIVTVNTRGAA